jgi:hypothetical protein
VWPFRNRKPVPGVALARIGNPNEVGPRHNALKREMAALRKEQEDGIVAAGRKVNNRDANYLRRLIQPWQIRALGYYDLLGEIKYSAQFYARSLSNLELFAAEIDPKTGDKIPTEDPDAIAALNRIKDPGGTGRKGLLADYGRLMFLTGEALMFVSQNPTTEKEQWEMLSTDELRLLDGNYTRFLAPSLPAMTFTPAPDEDYVPVGQSRNANGWLEGEYDDTAVAYRLWKRHPRFSMLPDSPMEGVLELCVARGTMVSTPHGARPIEDVQAGDTVYAWQEGQLVERTVAAASSTGINETVVVVAGRRTIRCTPEHRLLVLRRDNPGKGVKATVTTEWVRARDLVAGDYLIAADRIPDQGTSWVLPDGKIVTEEIAYFLGQVCGDGHITKYSVQISTFNAARDAELTEIVREVWGLEPHRRGRGDISWNSVELVNLLTVLGLRCKAPEKHVPPVVWQLSDDVKRAFLRGYEDADGHVTARGWQSHATSSERLARELRHLYIELGENVSNLHVQQRPEGGLVIAGNTKVTTGALPLHRFQVYYGSTRRGAVNTLKTASQRALVGDGFTLARVKRIENVGTIETFDLSVPDADCFIADGLVAHNCEELVLLTHAVRARARSRLAGSGILFIDDRITTRPQEAEPDEDIQEDPLLEDLTEAMTLPITDEGTASAVVPLLARVKVPDGMKLPDLVHHLQIIDPTQLYPETGLRMECIRRIAICLDMPTEILLGLGDLNHWNVWGIDEQSWKYHIQPIAEHLVNDLTGAYMGPYLKAQGKQDWDRFCIDYDASKVINHPDRSKDFFQAHAAGVVGDEALREAIGATEDDKPTQDELARIIGMNVKDAGLAWFGTPTPRGGFLETAPGEVVSAQTQGGGPAPGATGPAQPASPTPPGGKAQESTGASTTKGPPAGGPEGVSGGEGLTGSVAQMLTGAAGLGVLRAREAAGARIRTLARYDKDTTALIDGISPRDVASTVGRTKVRELAGGAKEQELIGPSRPLMLELCRQYGCTADVAATITDALMQHAARHLYDTRFAILPPNFTEFVAGLLRATRE